MEERHELPSIWLPNVLSYDTKPESFGLGGEGPYLEVVEIKDSHSDKVRETSLLQLWTLYLGKGNSHCSTTGLGQGAQRLKEGRNQVQPTA